MDAIIVTGGRTEEIAALALETQGRQTEDFIPLNTIKESVWTAIRDIAEKSQDS